MKKKEIERINGRLVLGDGEVTGHQHCIETPGVQLFQIREDLMELRAPQGAMLRHMRGMQVAEHRDIELSAAAAAENGGSFTVSHKRQYNGGDGGWSSVRD